MPIARIRCKKTGPYEVSRSRMRYRGARSHGNASVTWREIHSAVGFAVTPNDTQSRRPWRTMTRQYRIWNAIVGRTKRSIACVRTAHLANERAQLSRDLRSANTVAGSPAPIHPKPGTVPANDGLRPDNRNHRKDGRKPAIEPNK